MRNEKSLIKKLKKQDAKISLNLMHRQAYVRIKKELAANKSHANLSDIDFSKLNAQFLEYVLFNLETMTNIAIIKWHPMCVRAFDNDLKRMKLMEDIKEKLNENMQRYEEMPDQFYFNFNFED